MPTYEYRCKSCDQTLEVVQAFTDDPLTECPACGGELRKVFGNVGIAFKGSGFYKNDSRSGAGKRNGSSSSSESSAASSADTGSSSDKSSSSSDSSPSSSDSSSSAGSTKAKPSKAPAGSSSAD